MRYFARAGTCRGEEEVDDPWMAASCRQHLCDPVFHARPLGAADVLDLEALLVSDPQSVLADGLGERPGEFGKSRMRSLLP